MARESYYRQCSLEQQSVGSERQTEKRCKERAHNWSKYRAATDI